MEDKFPKESVPEKTEGKRSSKSHRRNSRGRGFHSRNSEDRGGKPFIPGNDFSWWSKEEAVIKDAVNLMCNSIAGTRVFGNATTNLINLPGVCNFMMANVYGSEFSATDPLNLQFRDLFLRMFQKYRGISAYQYSDLAIVTIATIEVISMVAKLERIYGIINYYDKLNLNVPTTILAALEVTPVQADYLRTHLSDFRFDLNVLLRRATRLCVPKDMSILADKVSLYGYIYKDHDAARSQIYVFNYDEFGLFNETSLSTGSAIEFIREAGVISGSAPYSSYALIQIVNPGVSMFPALETMINALVSSDSVNKIYADLTVWFGEDAMLHMLPLSEDYIVTPVYSESILHKIHNMDIYCADNTIGAADDTVGRLASVLKVNNITASDTSAIGVNRWIYQDDKGTVVTANSISELDAGGSLVQFTYRDENVSSQSFGSGPDVALASLKTYDRILDSYHADFTPEIVCEGVLFKTVDQMFTDSVTGDSCVVITSCVAEVCIGAAILTLNSNGVVVPMALQPCNVAYDAAKLALFDWAPILYDQYDAQNQALLNYAHALYGEIDTYRALSASEITRIHTAATLSGFKTDVTVINK